MDYSAQLHDAIESAGRQIKLAQSMQVRGLALLNSVPIDAKSKKLATDQIDYDGMAKLIRNATDAIEKGSKLETRSRDRLMDLTKRKERLQL